MRNSRTEQAHKTPLALGVALGDSLIGGLPQPSVESLMLEKVAVTAQKRAESLLDNLG